MSIAERSGEDVLGALIETTIIERISYLKPIVEGKAPESGGCRTVNDEALARWIDLGLRFREQRWMDPDNQLVTLTPRGSAIAALSAGGPTVRQWDADRFPPPPVEVLDELAAANEFGGMSSLKVGVAAKWPNLNFATGTLFKASVSGEILLVKFDANLVPWIYGLGTYGVKDKYPKREATDFDLEWANAHVYTEAAAG